MATQKKLEAPLKGNSGTSPSPTPPKAKKNSTSTTQKQVPSYLKPTVSSSSHVDNQHPHPKKPLTSTTNPNLSRRRSLEKLPSSSTVHKAPHTSLLGPSIENSSRHVDHQHPHPKKPLTSSTNPNLNRRRSFEKPPSSSTVHKFQHTSLLSAPPALSRTQSSPKTLAKKLIPSSSTKANTGLKKTKVSVPSTKETQVKIEADNGKKEDETNLENDVEEDEVKVIEINEDKFDEPEVPNVENPSVCEDVKESDLSNGKEPIADLGIEGVEEKKLVHEQEVVDNHDVNETKKDEKEDKTEKEDDGNEIDEVVKIDDAAKNEESIEMVLKEGEDEKEKDEKGKEATSDVQNAKVEPAKKEAQQHVQYNDVIEETKTKLMEKRKNKVKALVGAFETVISLEEA